MIKILKYLIILSIITSCQTSNSVNIDNYKNSPLPERKINISNNSYPKIVIIVNNNQSSEENNITKIIENSLSSYISRNTRLKLINRNKKASLEEELKLYEILSGSSKIIETPDYIVQIDVNPPIIGNNYVNFLAFIKIFSATKNEPLIVKKVEYKYSAFDENTIISQGALEMVEDKLGKIIDNFFRQLKEGLILQKKLDFKGNAIFKIDLGSGDGIMENKKLSIYRYDEATKELKKITDKAYVTNQISHDFSWIKVKNDNILYGDIARNDIEKIDENSSKNTTRNILIGAGTITILTAQFLLTILVAGALAYASSSSNINGGYYYHTNSNIR
jgi:hypothetical protein